MSIFTKSIDPLKFGLVLIIFFSLIVVLLVRKSLNRNADTTNISYEVDTSNLLSNQLSLSKLPPKISAIEESNGELDKFIEFLESLENDNLPDDSTEKLPNYSDHIPITPVQDTLQNKTEPDELSLLSFISEADLKRKVQDAISKGEEIVPKIVDYRVLINELEVYGFRHVEQREEGNEYLEQAAELRREYQALTEQAAELASFLRDDDVTTVIGNWVNERAVEIFKPVWTGEGWPSERE